ncbi:hypothetical protein LTR78_008613 [Recurvomyces mirabilis]|uniref:Uncharacterized protein n=1 Tax=Recurvomyces mirabilis TaxID=574656 RepID=A0AAE0TTI2_9PEZI|nr:hypothetical protein LTR78_008613 [Recurvomyces mirabilis]KAK5153475.1 hypothetical protein LTS14_007646 [Recurvomyces mirabilis]
MSPITQYLGLACLITSITANPIKSFDSGFKHDLQSPMPTPTVEFLPRPNINATPSPVHTPSSPITFAPVTYASDLKRDVTSIPNLVPTSPVDLATDTTGTRTISPLFMPTKIATIGSAVTTAGCEVSIVDYEYVTSCSDVNGALSTTAAGVVLGELETTVGIGWCCGGEEDLHAWASGVDVHLGEYDVRWRYDCYGYAWMKLLLLLGVEVEVEVEVVLEIRVWRMGEGGGGGRLSEGNA